MPALFEPTGGALLEEGSSDETEVAQQGWLQINRLTLGKAVRRPRAAAAGILGAGLLVAAAVKATLWASSPVAGAPRSSVGLLDLQLPCKAPESGSSCERDIHYAMKHIKDHPDWYVGLHEDSNFKQVQAFLHKQRGRGGVPRCPLPCGHILSEDDGHKALYSGKCHTAHTGEECYNHVVYTMKENLPNHPEWYPGLHEDAGFKVVQDYLHQQGVCPTPCGLAAAKKAEALKHKKKAEDEEEMDEGCHTAAAGEPCYGDILWAREHLKRRNEWYKGLTSNSSNDEIQAFLSRQHNEDPSKLCPTPCNKTAIAMLEHVNVASSCHTAQHGVPCYKSVLWVIAEGLQKHPKWYPNLTRKSTFEAVQQRLVLNQDKHCTRDPCPCRTAEDGDKCHKAIAWVQKTGLKKHPKWYKGLNENSTLEEIQTRLHEDKHPLCPLPCQRTPWLKYDEKGNPVSVPIDIKGKVIDAWPEPPAGTAGFP